MDSRIIIISLCCYLIALIVLGSISRKRTPQHSLKEFYLAGPGLGSFILLFTLYATQYSANTMLVVPAEVVNKGLGMILVLGYMTAVVVCYLAFAPQLYFYSRQHTFITPGDWFNFRFNSPRLTMLANLVFLVVSINFLLAQLMAMGTITHSITNGVIPYWAGVLALGLVVIIYETIGGMRAVAWTDVLQGSMLLLGLIGIFFIARPSPERLSEIIRTMIQNEPEKVRVPSWDFRLYWVSTVLMVGLGAAVYPQAIQRIYAARSLRSLKGSLSFMVFMPLLTVLILFLLGVMSMPHFRAGMLANPDSVLPQMLTIWAQQSNLAFAMALLVIIGLVAAIMSTADSVLLSISSILTKDILGKFWYKNASERELTRYGKIISWAIMAGVTIWALNPRMTLWGLIELKMQILIQVAPLFLLGLRSDLITSRGAYLGLCVGLGLSLATFIFGPKTILGIQSGLIAFFINLTIARFVR